MDGHMAKVRDAEPEIRESTGTLQELLISLGWLAIAVVTTNATLRGQELSGVLAEAVAQLPSLVAASLLAGIGLGAAAGSRFSSVGARLAGGLAVAIFFGIAAGVAVRLAYGPDPAIMSLAVTVAVAAIMGGLTAGFPSIVLEATLWATTFAFALSPAFGALQLAVGPMLGGGPQADQAAQAAAESTFAYGQSMVIGLLIGLYSLQRLRRQPPNWFWCLVAGALPGLILLGSEYLSRMAGSTVLGIVNGTAPGEPSTIDLTDPAAVYQALIVLGLGAVIASFAATRRGSDD
jgi:hypothetical protein